MDNQISLRAEQASRVGLFLYQLGIVLLVFLIMMPMTLYFFGASLIAIPVCTIWILLVTAWLNKNCSVRKIKVDSMKQPLTQVNESPPPHLEPRAVFQCQSLAAARLK